MRSFLFIATLGFFFSTNAQTFKARQVMGSKTQIIENNATYEKDLDYLFVEVDGTKQETYLQLSKAQRDSLKVLLLKFKEWTIEAEVANRISDKAIGSFTCSAGFRVGESLYTNPGVPVTLYFYSYQGKTKGKTEMTITVASFPSSKNKDMVASIRSIVLSKEGVNQLLNAVDNEKIAERMRAKEKENEIIR